MKHFMSEVELAFEEITDLMKEGNDPSLATQMRQAVNHLKLDTKKALDEARDCISDFANELIGRKQETLGEKFIYQAEILSSKLKKVANSQKDNSIVLAVNKLIALLSTLIDKIKKTFGFSKDLLSHSPTVLNNTKRSLDKKQPSHEKHTSHQNNLSKSKKKH